MKPCRRSAILLAAFGAPAGRIKCPMRIGPGRQVRTTSLFHCDAHPGSARGSLSSTRLLTFSPRSRRIPDSLGQSTPVSLHAVSCSALTACVSTSRPIPRSLRSLRPVTLSRSVFSSSRRPHLHTDPTFPPSWFPLQCRRGFESPNAPPARAPRHAPRTLPPQPPARTHHFGNGSIAKLKTIKGI